LDLHDVRGHFGISALTCDFCFTLEGMAAVVYLSRPDHMQLWEAAPHMRTAMTLCASLLHAAPLMIVAPLDPPLPLQLPADDPGAAQSYTHS
jgi:hypothetical protein